MRAMKRRLALTVVVCMASLGCLAAQALPAAASGHPTGLGRIGFGSILVDSRRSHVFVSGPDANVVDVFDLSSHLLATIGDVYGARGMAMDRRTLYVAESTAGAIARIRLSTLQRRSDLTTAIVAPNWLVITGGTLWATAGTDYQAQQLSSIDLSTGSVTTFSRSYYDPDLAVSAGAPNTIFLAQDGLSPGSIYRLDVSSGTPTVVASNTFTDQENIQQLALSPDGTRIIPASGAPYAFEELSASTIQPDGIIYPGKPYPSAVATSTKGMGRLATGLEHGYSSPDIQVFSIGTPAPIFSATTQDPGATANVLPHGLALDAGGTTLFAVVGSDLKGSRLFLLRYSIP